MTSTLKDEEHKTLARSLTGLTAMAMLMTVSATAVGAVRSYNGSDYSYDYGSNHSYIATCDLEGDETKVKSVTDSDRYNGGESDAAKDVDGANGICATANMGYSIYRHQTCEYRALWKDACDNWQAV